MELATTSWNYSEGGASPTHPPGRAARSAHSSPARPVSPGGISHAGWCAATTGSLVRDQAKAGVLREEGVAIVEGDLTRAQDVDAAVRGCSHVYHIAALYREARHPDRVYHDVDIDRRRRVLDAAAWHGVERVVHCSTVGVHGAVDRRAADEDAPFNPGDIYQEIKLEGELAAREAFAGGLAGTVVPPAATYGPGARRFLKLFRMV